MLHSLKPVACLTAKSLARTRASHKRLESFSRAQNRVMATANGTSTLQIYDLSPEPGICPFVQRAKITLKEKNLPYNTTYINALDKPKDFLDLFRGITSNTNHRGTVPVLIDGDVKLAESHIVSEYLDQKNPNSGTKLLPTDPYKLALVRQFIENYTVEVQPPGFKIQAAETRDEVKEALQKFTDGLKVLDTFLKTYGDKSGDFLLGKDFSYAEAATLPFLYRAHLLLKEYRDIDLNQLISDNKLNHLQKWQKAGFARESVKGTLPPDNVIVDLGKKRVKVALKDLK